MKQIYIFLCALFWMYSAHAQQFIVDTLKLNTAYRELMKDPSDKNEQNFFNAFPKTWKEYINLYDYPAQKGGDKTMYFLCEEHIKAFDLNLWDINRNAYHNRLIDLGIGGEWAMDAPHYLQEVIHHHMGEDMEEIMVEISKRNKADQKSFWRFYWTSQLRGARYKREVNRMEKIFRDDFPKETAIMVQAYKDTRGKYKPAPGIYY